MTHQPICCENCVWSAIESVLGHRAPVNPDTKLVLACRRHAPASRGFPWVAPQNWCGDFFQRQPTAQDGLESATPTQSTTWGTLK